MPQENHPLLPLSWMTTPLLFKVHPSFLLPFFHSPSHEGKIMRGGGLRCAGEFFPRAADLLYSRVNSHIKDMIGKKEGKQYPFLNTLHDTSHPSSHPSSPSIWLSSLLFFLWYLRNPCPKTDPMTCHYTPLASFLTWAHTLMQQWDCVYVLWVGIRDDGMAFVWAD